MLGMIAVASTALGLMADAYAFVLLVLPIAAWGAWRGNRWNLRQDRRMLLFVALALALAIKHRLMPYEPSMERHFFYYIFSLAYAAGQFAVLAQVVMLWLRYPRGLPRSGALLGAVAVLCAGNFLPTRPEEWAYRALAAGYVLLMGLFFLSRQERLRRVRRGLAAGVIMSVAAGIGMLLAILASQAMNRYGTDAMNFFLKYHPWNQAFQPGADNHHPTLDSISSMRLGRRSRAVVLRVYSDRRPGYLRGAVYDYFEQSSWSRSLPGDSVAGRTQGPDGPDSPAGPVFAIRPADGPWARMEIWRDPDSRLGLFTTLRTGYVAAPVQSIYVGPHATARSEQLPSGVNVELLEGRAHAVAATPTVVNACLHVPPELRGQLEALAGQLFDASDSAERKVAAVQRYFRNQYRYKLGIAIPFDADPMAWFLSEKPPAHCEFFAAAATLVLRAGGVPARYVTGFVAREWNEAGGYWIARNKDAHAWAEAYDPATRRWVTVEATPAQGVPGDEKTPLLAGLIDAAEQALLSLRTAQFRHGIKGVAMWLARAFVVLLSLLVTTWVGWLILAVLVAWLGPRSIRRLGRLLRRGRRRPVDPQIQAMRRLLGSMDRRVARLGLARRDGETLHRFAARIEPRDPAAAAWYIAYARRRYSARLRPTDLDALRNDLPGRADRSAR